MDVSIIILNYKSRGLLKQCIKTIGLVSPKISYEIIVVDNDSQDGTADMLAERFPQIRFIPAARNLGYAGGNNLGIAASSGRYVMIMNPDITVRPGSIDAMVAYMDANRDIGVLGPKLTHPDGTLDESCFRFPSPAIPVYRRTPLGKLGIGREALSHYLMNDYDRVNTRDVDWLLGAVLLVRREALAKVGPLDERYFLYFEDTDWCRRFWLHGWRVTYFTGANMVHYHERLSARGNWLVSPLRKSTRIHLTSCVRYFRKWKDAEPVRMPERA